MKKKMKIFALAPILLASTLPLISCNNATINNSSVSDEKWEIDNSENTNINSTISKNILNDSVITKQKQVINTDKSLTNNSVQNVVNFLKNPLFATEKQNYITSVTSADIIKDINLFMYNTWNKNNKLFNLSYNGYSQLKKDANNTINGTIAYNISSDTPITIDFLDKKINLKNSNIIKFTFTNTTYDLTINSYNNKFYLGLIFNNIKVITDEQSFDLNNFTFTPNSNSHVFNVEVENLTNSLDYLSMLEDKEIMGYYNNLTIDEIKKSLSDVYTNEFNKNINYMKLLESITSAFVNDLTADKFISQISSPLIDLVIEANIIKINEDVQKLLKDFLKIDQPLINAIYNNRDTVLNILSSIIGTDPFIFGIVENIVNLIDPYNDNRYELVEAVKSLADFIGGPAKEIILKVAPLLNDVMDKKTTFQFLQKIINSNEIQTILGPEIKQLLDLVFNQTNSQRPIIDVVMENKQTLANFLKKILGNNAIIGAILDMFFTNNANLSSANIKLMFNEINSLFKLFVNKSHFVNKGFDSTFSYTNYNVNGRYEIDLIIDENFSMNFSNVFSFLPDKIELNKIITTLPIPISIDKKEIINNFPTTINFTKGDSLSFTYINENDRLWLNPINYNFGYKWIYKENFKLNSQSFYNSFVDKNTNPLKQPKPLKKNLAEFIASEHNSYKEAHFIDTSKKVNNLFDENISIDGQKFDWKDSTPMNSTKANTIETMINVSNGDKYGEIIGKINTLNQERFINEFVNENDKIILNDNNIKPKIINNVKVNNNFTFRITILVANIDLSIDYKSVTNKIIFPYKMLKTNNELSNVFERTFSHFNIQINALGKPVLNTNLFFGMK